MFNSGQRGFRLRGQSVLTVTRHVQADCDHETGFVVRHAGRVGSLPAMESARVGAAELLRDDRVLRVMVVRNEVPPAFVEWVER